MKIERDNSRDLAEIVRDGIQALVHGQPPEKSPEARLVAQRDRKRRSFRSHWHAFISVMSGLGVLNLVTWLLGGLNFPWMIFPMAVWGIGMGMHALNYRAWTQDHAAQLRAAETALGLLPPGQAPLLMEAGPPASDPWSRLIQQCRTAVDRTSDALAALAHPAQNIEMTMVHLEEGMEKIERLAEGAARIQQALGEIAPGGLSDLDAEVTQIERSINAAADPGLREVHHANRTLLVARRAKVQALLSDQERMMANARGFLLATENLRLDTARIGNDALASGAHLTAPLERLSEEVDVLRRVEAELQGM